MRVLVVDDSAASQRAVSEILAEGEGVEVVGRASDGEEALRLALELEPDCICLDLGMPRMDGFTFLRLLMARRPTPVIVVSSNARKQEVFKALELGALDFVAKPTHGERPWEEELSVREELLAKIETVRALRVESLAGEPEEFEERGRAERRAVARPRRIVVVGASTGGPTALTRLFARLSPELPLGYAIALHMPERFTRAFAERMARRTGFEVLEAGEGDELLEGRVFVAPGGRHLKLVPERGPGSPLRAALLAAETSVERYCPSADLLFESAAVAMPGRVCAVVLTGMGDDGRRGVEAVADSGGLALAESQESAVVYGMPQKAAATGRVEVLTLERIAARLERFAEGR